MLVAASLRDQYLSNVAITGCTDVKAIPCTGVVKISSIIFESIMHRHVY